ncbi:MAG: cytochrome c3 family protein [Thermodesulfobacteriota bacterium]
MVGNPAPRATLKIPLQGITILSATLVIFLILSIPVTSLAKATGPCVNCHTMHNSQGGAAMATYGGETGPNSLLTRGSCIGCHAQGTANKIVTIGGSDIPQVYHTDGSGDLAGGNFKYIETDDNRGHNVSDFGNPDGILNSAPGHHSTTQPTTNTLTCAGHNGCHGYRRFNAGSGLPTLKGAHHGNVDGKCDSATTVANSYRFLYNVKGLENMGANKYQNLNATDHNEYFGTTSPGETGCVDCHDVADDMKIKSPNNTISGFCSTCHSNFHKLSGIGGSTTGPFTRHPTDVVLPDDVSKEYKDYTTYSVEAPVGRTTVPDAPSGTVTPGTDVVTCLSCHAAHATNYPDMLRWDYTTMIASGESNTTGCFTCHTQKDD